MVLALDGDSTMTSCLPEAEEEDGAGEAAAEDLEDAERPGERDEVEEDAAFFLVDVERVVPAFRVGMLLFCPLLWGPVLVGLVGDRFSVV